MLKKYKITYTEGKKHHEEEVEAHSKYNAKTMFYIEHPKAEIVSVEEEEG